MHLRTFELTIILTIVVLLSLSVCSTVRKSPPTTSQRNSSKTNWCNFIHALHKWSVSSIGVHILRHFTVYVFVEVIALKLLMHFERQCCSIDRYVKFLWICNRCYRFGWVLAHDFENKLWYPTIWQCSA